MSGSVSVSPAGSVSSLIVPWSRPVRLIVLINFLATVVVALGGMTTPASIALGVCALMFFGLALLVLTSRDSDPLSAQLTAVVLLCAAAVTASEFLHLSIETRGLYSAWHIGAVAFILMGLMFRSRELVAWIAFGFLVAAETAYTVNNGQAPIDVVPLVIRHLGSLIVTAAIVYALRRVARRLVEVDQQASLRETAEAVRREVELERAEQLVRFDAIAGHLLRRIASGVPLTQEQKSECLIVEASLRDTMSGRGLATPEVLRAAREARERGVKVILLDDSQGLHPDRLAVAAELSHELTDISAGSVTARLLPVGRENAGSILVERPDGTSNVREIKTQVAQR